MGMPAVTIEYVCAPNLQPERKRPRLVLLPPYSERREKIRRKKVFRNLKIVANGVCITVQGFVYFVMACIALCGIAPWFCITSIETFFVASLILPMSIGIDCLLVGYVMQLKKKHNVIKRTRKMFDIHRLCVDMIYTLIRNTVVATLWFQPIIEYIMLLKQNI